MENIRVIKVVSIYSEIIWYHFTVDSFVAGITFFDNFGLSFLSRRFDMHRSCLALLYSSMHVKSMMSHF